MVEITVFITLNGYIKTSSHSRWQE